MKHLGLAWALGIICFALSAHAQDNSIHQRVVTFDAHVDIPLTFATPANDPAIDGLDPVDLAKMDRGMLDGAAFALFAPTGPRTAEGFSDALEQAEKKLASIHRLTRKLYPDRIGVALNSEDMLSLPGTGRHFALISVLSGYFLGADAEHLEKFVDGGVRMIAFTHRGHNQLADSARPNPRLGDKQTLHGGLSPLGRSLIPKLNRMGVIIDVSQISHDALMQTVALTEAPVVASHVGIRALMDHPRNLTDEALLAIKQSGGVVHIVAFDGYLKPTSPERATAILDLLSRNPRETEDQRASYRRETLEINERHPGASVSDLVDQIDYVVNLLGIDHVGVATDFNHGGGITGWVDMADAPNVTRELLARGYTEEEIAKIWSGNFIRAFAEVEAVAARLNE